MILHGGHAGADGLARFRTEARAIARLQHPHIVQVYEVGDQDGLPYFSLEFCPGGSLEKKLNGTPLPPREAARLVEQLARAMDAAHQARIVHRDLKPANVLLASGGRQPPEDPQRLASGDSRPPLALEHYIPKITDFGLAKKLDVAGPTQTGEVMGTPSYMAPEQAGGQPGAVGPAADIYALGAILYECLTGRPPFRAATVLDTLLQVAGEDPVPPRQLQPKTPRDLETICLKCLRKEPGKRYASAAALAADCAAFLKGEPIAARPAGVVERGWRWCRRQPVLAGLVLTGCLLVAALAAGVVGTTWWLVEARRQRDAADKARDDEAAQRRRAEGEAAIAKAVNEFLQKDLLGQADIANQPPTWGGERDRNITVAELLDRAARRIEGKFVGQPLTEASIRLTLGDAYRALGRYAAAQSHVERSVGLRTARLGADHPDTLATKNNLALLYKAKGKYDQAEPLYQEVLAGRTARLGADHPDTLITKNNLAALYEAQGKYGRAEPLLRDVLAGQTTKRGADHPATLASKNNLAMLYQAQRKYDRAEPLLRDVLAGQTTKLGADHPDTLTSKNNLAVLYSARGKHDRAEPLYQEVLAGRTARLGADHPNTLNSKNNLAMLYQAQGKYDRAEPLFREAVERARKKPGLTHPMTQSFFRNLADCYEKMGQPARGEPFLRELADFCKHKDGPDSPPYAGALAALGWNLLRQQKFADAEKLLRDALAIRQKTQADDWTTFNTQSLLGGSLLGQRKYAEAEPLLLAGYQGMKQRETQIPASGKARLTEALERLVQLYDATGQKDKADQWHQQLPEPKAAAKPPAKP
jgi:tetratricopeptide (TPR) repeat protein